MAIKLQDLFNLAINEGVYPEQTPYMCHALRDLCRSGKIDRAARDRGHSAIAAYLNHISPQAPTLFYALRSRGLIDSCPEKPTMKEVEAHLEYRKTYLLSIFLKWEDKPYPPRIER